MQRRATDVWGARPKIPTIARNAWPGRSVGRCLSNCHREEVGAFMLRTLVLLFALVVLAMPCCTLAAYVDLPLEFNHRGVLKSISDGPREQPIEGNLLVFQQGYTRTTTLWQLQEIKRTEEDGWQTIDGTLTTPDGKRLKVRQQFKADDASSTRVKLRVEAIDAVETDAVAYLLNVPVHLYDNGTCVANGDARSPIALPERFTKKDLASVGSLASVVFTSKSKPKSSIELRVDRERNGFVQDNRAFDSQTYGVGVQVYEGAMRAGDVAEQTFTIRAHEEPVTEAYRLVVDEPDPTRPAFTGIGGNFVYGIDSAATRKSLEAFDLPWVRVGMELAEWEPTNDNTDPNAWNAKRGVESDVAGSKLRKRFELDRELFRRVPPGRFIASVWYLPEWLYAEPMPSDQPRDRAGTVPEERWPELIECVVSYLLHMKERYGVEPALFSFNESDMGVHLKLNADETRKITIRLGEAFAKAQLSTKLLLGDSADPVEGLDQITPTMRDAAAMKHVGALGVHAWKAPPNLWVKAATEAGLPLLITEVGADAEAWQDGSFAGERYWLKEARNIVVLLGGGSAGSAMLQWEWSDDYSLWATAGKELAIDTPRGKSTRWLNRTARGTPRFVFLRHESDEESIRMWTAIQVSACLMETPSGQVWHFVNRGDARDVVAPQIVGVAGWKAVVIDFKNGERPLELPADPSKPLTLPARSHVVVYPASLK
jgi:hypothetical protein